MRTQYMADHGAAVDGMGGVTGSGFHVPDKRYNHPQFVNDYM